MKRFLLSEGALADLWLGFRVTHMSQGLHTQLRIGKQNSVRSSRDRLDLGSINRVPAAVRASDLL